MEEIVASAKADGANWTVDQWKDAYRNMAINVKPMMDEMKEMMELLEKDPTKAMEMVKPRKQHKPSPCQHQGEFFL